MLSCVLGPVSDAVLEFAVSHLGNPRLLFVQSVGFQAEISTLYFALPNPIHFNVRLFLSVFVHTNTAVSRVEDTVLSARKVPVVQLCVCCWLQKSVFRSN